MKKLVTLIMSVVLLVSFASVGATVSAEPMTAVEGVRWFPCEPGRENDELWEVECEQYSCLCQPVYYDESDIGYASFLDTVYDENGALTITRNGNDGNEYYWPRIRTLSLGEYYPVMDLHTANTLYFDFIAREDTQWNMLLEISGYTVKLSQVIAEACGVYSVANSDADGPTGHFAGTLNLQDALAIIAAENGTESAANARALLNLDTMYVPQVQVFCIGPVGASITLNELFISTAEDVTGDSCEYADLGMILGDEIYDEFPELEIFTCGDYDYTILDDGTAEIYMYHGTEQDVVIPDELDGMAVTSVGMFAFYDVTSIVIPDTVRMIGMYAFAGVDTLKEVTIPTSVVYIDEGAFEDTALTDIYYGGTAKQWEEVEIASNNPEVLLATMHYTAKPPVITTTTTVTTTTTTTITEAPQTTTTTITQSPQTGENSTAMVWIVVMMAAMVTVWGALRSRVHR